MKRKLITGLVILGLVLLVYWIFSFNSVRKSTGLTITIKPPKNCEVLNTTWKDNSIWLFVEDTITKEKRFIEYSNMGILEGEVNFK